MERAKRRSYSFSNWDSSQRIYYHYNHPSEQPSNSTDMPTYHHRNNSSTADQEHSIASFANKNYSRERDQLRHSTAKEAFNDRKNSKDVSFDAWNGSRTRASQEDTRQYQRNSRYARAHPGMYESMEPEPTTFAPNRANQYQAKDYPSRHDRVRTQASQWQQCGDSRNSVWQLNKMNQEKLSNIDRINSKIKRILDTLNEEESKISSASYLNKDFKIRPSFDSKDTHNYQSREKQTHEGKDRRSYESKDMHNYENREKLNYDSRDKSNHDSRDRQNNQSRFKHTYESKDRSAYQNRERRDYRIKTQGDCEEELEAGRNIYGKLLDIKQKYKHNRHNTSCIQQEHAPPQVANENQYGWRGQNGQKIDANRPYGISNLQKQQRKPLASLAQNSMKWAGKQFVHERHRAYLQETSYHKVNNNEDDIDDAPRFVSSNKIQRNRSESQYQEQPSRQNTFSSKEEQVFRRPLPGENKDYSTPTKSRCLSKSRSGKSVKLSNGKDVDAEITRIQQKIDTVNQIKKSLIDPSQENLDNSIIAGLMMTNSSILQPKSTHPAKFQHYQHSPQHDNKQSLDVSLPKPFKLSNKRRQAHIIQENSNVKQIESALISEDRVNFSIQDSTITIKNKQGPYDNIKQDSFSSSSGSKNFLTRTAKKYENNSAEIDVKIQERSKNVQTFIHHICEQIQLDSKLRDIKKWFKNYRHPDKWQQLFKVVNASHKTNMQMDIIRKVFQLHEDEDNPFLTIRDAEGSIPQLVESYVESEEHWQRQIGGKLEKQEVECVMKGMDIDRKGWVSVQDMVRYVNVESDQYFRNRDLILIYHRFQGLYNLDKSVDLRALQAQLSL